jgi:hypothetical protein
MESGDVSRNRTHDSTFKHGSCMVVVYTVLIALLMLNKKDPFLAKKI